jgi:hypothetical protein
MIQFRCWHCRKLYRVADYRVGERLTCACQRELRVPKKSGGDSQIRRLIDWLVEVVVFGGIGAVVGAAAAIAVVIRYSAWFEEAPRADFRWWLLAATTLFGFALSTFIAARLRKWWRRRKVDPEDQ